MHSAGEVVDRRESWLLPFLRFAGHFRPTLQLPVSVIPATTGIPRFLCPSNPCRPLVWPLTYCIDDTTMSQFQVTAAVACHCFSVPISLVPSERLFSATGCLLSFFVLCREMLSSALRPTGCLITKSAPLSPNRVLIESRDLPIETRE